MIVKSIKAQLRVRKDLMVSLSFPKDAIIHFYGQLKENKLSIPTLIHISKKEWGL